MTARPIRVALAEDHPVLRDRLVQQLAYFDEVDLVLVADSGDALVADLTVRERSGGPFPQVVLMDIEMPGTDGIGTTAAVRGIGRRTGSSRIDGEKGAGALATWVRDAGEGFFESIPC